MSANRTPPVLTDELRAFCAKISDTTPLFLQVTPAKGADELDCFEIVARHTIVNGGNPCYGWQIWEWPGIMLEAEAHCTWIDPAGQFHDLTPKPGGVNKILFLPDPALEYRGQQLPSIRKPLRNDAIIAELIAVRDAEFEFMNRGQRAHQHGEIPLTPSEGDEYRALLVRRNKAAAAVAALSKQLQQPLSQTIGSATGMSAQDAKEVRRRERNRVKKARQKGLR